MIYFVIFIAVIIGILIYLFYKDYEIKNIKITDNTNIGNKVIGLLNHKFFSFSKTESSWNPMSKEWENNSEKYSLYWKQKAPIIKNILSSQKIKPDNSFKNKAVIHFRCSDVPFVKHSQYHLLPKEYFYFIAKELEEKNIDEILFLNCSDWNSHQTPVKDPHKICNSYIKIISDWIQEKTPIKINKNKICTSVKETYSIMLGSKVLVSTGGSFSFIPGITKGKNYITASNIGEVDQEILRKWKDLHKNVHWKMWDKFDKISHKNLDYNTFDYKNYSNIKHVSKN